MKLRLPKNWPWLLVAIMASLTLGEIARLNVQTFATERHLDLIWKADWWGDVLQPFTQIIVWPVIGLSMALGFAFGRSLPKRNVSVDQFTAANVTLAPVGVTARTGIDWKAVDRLDSFTLFDAASYLAEQRPPKDEEGLSDRARVELKLLKQAIQAGALPLHRGDNPSAALFAISMSLGGEAPNQALVLRKALIDYALAKGEKPKFLFPNER